MMADFTATVTFDGVDMDTGEMVTTIDAGRGPSEVRIPLERVLGWKARRREREVLKN